jgi:hypothetical protein
MKPWVLIGLAVTGVGLGWISFQDLGRTMLGSKSAETSDRTPQPAVRADDFRPAPVPPRVKTLAPGERVRLPAVDFDQPPPLPFLTPRSRVDRAPVEDATAEASASAALASTPPQRTRPVPFQRMTIPDPFGDRRPERVGPDLPERTNLPIVLPKTPAEGSRQKPK